MGKTLLIFSAMVALMCAAPASAETIEVGGTVPTQCKIDPGSSSVNFGTLNNDGYVPPQTNTYNLYCNVNFSFAYTSQNGRLINTNATPGTIGPEPGPGNYNGSSSFFAALDYTITSGSGEISTADMTANTEVEVPLVLPPSSYPFTLEFETVPLASGDLTAGAYEDTFTLTLQPQGL